MTKIDNTIITRCQKGDKDAFRSLVETCQGMVFSVALKMLADEEEAKDIVQETFLRVWLNISRYDSRCSFTTWLYAIVSRLCLDHLKSRARIVAIPEDESVLRRYASVPTASFTILSRASVSFPMTTSSTPPHASAIPGLTPSPCSSSSLLSAAFSIAEKDECS